MAKEIVTKVEEKVKAVVSPKASKRAVAEAEIANLKKMNQRMILSNGQRIECRVAYLEGYLVGLSE